MAFAWAGTSASAMGSVPNSMGSSVWKAAYSGLSGLVTLFQARGASRAVARKPMGQNIGSKPPCRRGEQGALAQ